MARWYGTLRNESRRAVDQFFANAEDGLGGTLTWRAPCISRKRSVMEAWHRDERDPYVVGVTWPEDVAGR
jgi:hypothetical protein